MRRFALLFALLALPAAAQSLDWSAAGSAGVVDPGTISLGLYTFNGAVFQVKTTAIATVEARYPVTNTYGSAFSLTPAWSTLKMTYADNDATGSPAAAQTYDWSMVGSAGQADPNANGYVFTGPSFAHSSARTGNLIARYQVTNTYGSSASLTPPWTTLTAAYTDDSASGSLTIRLLKVDKCNNTETQLCSITSSDSADPHCSTCTFSSSNIDFANFTYYVEVKLSRTSTSAHEVLHSLGIN